MLSSLFSFKNEISINYLKQKKQINTILLFMASLSRN